MSAVAITAMAGVFPGPAGAVTISEFGGNIVQGRPAVVRSLQSRWGLSRDRYFHPEAGTPNRTYLDSAYTISERSGPTQLDFGRRVLSDLVGAVEGTALPPPQRIGLCLAMMWTEPAYYAADFRRVLGDESLARTTGGGARDHQSLMSALASAVAIAGPCLGIDAACASSLYALDAAIGFLHSGRADAMVVLGLNASVPLFMFLGFAKLRALSPRAEILPFSADASGIVPSEAVAAILVEPLEQALAARRTPLAIVRALGLSADGGDTSVFAPSASGQRLAYERAYASIDPATIDYVEAHGAATPLGDETELDTLDAFFRTHHTALPIGSVKALIGHTLPTAGLASIIKSIVMMRERVIAPHVKVQLHRRFAGSCLRLPFVPKPWAESGRPRRVGISAFGFGGSNAHLVLEAFTPAPAAPVVRRTPRTLGVIAVEAAVGEAADCGEVAARLDAHERPDAPFPWTRFGVRESGEPAARVDGSFFPGTVLIDGAGLRMGPKALERVDPLQRVVIDLVHRALDGRPFPDGTAVVVCSNLGGAISLQLARRYQDVLNRPTSTGARGTGEDPATESIASSLSSMISGFPTFHFGLMGFHVTLSGGAASFWDALSLVPYWLGGTCRLIALVAARVVKSPVDLDGAVEPGEGCTVFLLEDGDACRGRGEEPLALIGDATDGPPAFEISQLDSAAPVSERGLAQQVFGFLEEATGAEALLHALLAPGTGTRVIEVRHGAAVTRRIAIDKRRERPAVSASARTPVPVVFHAPAADGAGRPSEGSAADLFAAWQEASTRLMRSYFAAQRRIAQLDTRPPLLLHETRRAAHHVVIGPPAVDREEVSAALCVDESHPYFFDHPLDHVPGFLILEGALQLVDRVTPPQAFVRALDLRFKRFSEKTPAPVLRARAEDGTRYEVTLEQDRVHTATCRVEIATAPPRTLPAAEPAAGGEVADRALVHKTRGENVVIRTIQATAGGDRCECHLLAPPRGHALDDGDPSCWSALYLIEAARQFALTLAHQVEGIPLGLPMTLLAIRLTLTRPALKGEPLHMECGRQPLRHMGAMTLADFALEVHAADGRIGEVVIAAQIVSEGVYLAQRGRG